MGQSDVSAWWVSLEGEVGQLRGEVGQLGGSGGSAEGSGGSAEGSAYPGPPEASLCVARPGLIYLETHHVIHPFRIDHLEHVACKGCLRWYFILVNVVFFVWFSV